jgi:hypothetical protein
MTTESEVVKFSEELYAKLIANFSDINSPFVLLTRDDGTFPQFPGLTSANVRNVLVGGDSSGTASYEEFVRA